MTGLLDMLNTRNELGYWKQKLDEKRASGMPALEVLEAYIQMMNRLMFHHLLEEGVACFEEALKYREEKNVTDDEALGALLYWGGKLHLKLEHWEQGKTYLLAARECFMKVESYKLILAGCCKILSRLYLSEGQLKEGRRFAEECIACYKNSLGESCYLAQDYDDIGKAFQDLHVYHEAIEYDNAAVRVYRRRIRSTRGLDVMFLAKRESGYMCMRDLYQRIAQCHKEMGNHFRSVVHNLMSLEMSVKYLIVSTIMEKIYSE